MSVYRTSMAWFIPPLLFGSGPLPSFKIKKPLEWSNAPEKNSCLMHQPTKKHEGNNRIRLSQVKTKATHLVGDLFVQRAAVVRRVTFSTQNGTVWKLWLELQSIYMTCRLRRQAGAKRTAQFTALSNVHMLLRFPIPTVKHKHAICNGDFCENPPTHFLHWLQIKRGTDANMQKYLTRRQDYSSVTDLRESHPREALAPQLWLCSRDLIESICPETQCNYAPFTRISELSTD